MKVKVVGVRSVSFKGTNGEDINGKTVYFVDMDSIPEQYGLGHVVDRLFVSDSKIARSGSNLEVSKTYEVFYNRYGKIDSWKEISG